jgi:hypothetical protein
MKALLVLQEGPGAGSSFTLDPFTKPSLSVGRSSDCDITLADGRASRHHSDIRWDGRQWVVVDRGSTNGTYVNGLQVRRPYDLRLGDRITIGETTLVLREWGTAPGDRPATPVRQPRPVQQRGPTMEGPVQRAAPRAAAPAASSGGGSVAFWAAQGIVVVAIICLAAGALLPWLKVSGSLSQDLQPLVQGIANLVASLSGSDSMFNVTQEIGGLEGYGKLTLGLALIATIVLIVDLFFYRKSVVPGIVYLVTGLVAVAAIGLDLVNYYRYYEQIQDLSLLFGMQLSEVIQVFDQFIDVQITPMVGLPLTGAGLILLLVGGGGRLLVSFLDRGR